MDSPSDLIERLTNIDSSDTIHLVSNSTLNFDVKAFDKHQLQLFIASGSLGNHKKILSDIKY